MQEWSNRLGLSSRHLVDRYSSLLQNLWPSWQRWWSLRPQKMSSILIFSGEWLQMIRSSFTQFIMKKLHPSVFFTVKLMTIWKSKDFDQALAHIQIQGKTGETAKIVNSSQHPNVFHCIINTSVLKPCGLVSTYATRSEMTVTNPLLLSVI